MVVPEYRRSGRTYYSCTGTVAKRWQAAYEAAELGLVQGVMEERQRCTQVLMDRHENHPQNGEQWDSTFYDIAEEIMAGPSRP